ncbi:hypothetical protein PTE30175_02709 [Pandoraea terrae]|uniref:TenA family transcriptional regulator n=1 Tax=Pandoraea terrae TaxID=1537710 RepID=A0A5E4VSP7_9BURK|nr:iron-containing redox enzyme family protein [Pandoraea terrae]VVE14110.1 hypothetical protein PTE30175_02709 [Pandoraea terrae]
MRADYAKDITSLANTVFSHEALNNRFYETWIDNMLPPEHFEVFARNYLARTSNTATMVALSLISTDDLDARVEIAKNLHSEYGYGNPEKAHLNLLKSFLFNTLSRMHGHDYREERLNTVPILPSTKDFICLQRELYTDKGRASRVMGTLLAQEWLAYSMLTRLYEGARNYQHLFETNDEFHESCEYFYVHIGEAEKSHKVQAIVSASRECACDDDFENMSQGFHQFLEITARYWNAIYKRIT